MVFTDSHAHLTMEVFNPDRDAVLSRAREAGLRHLCTIASPIADAEAALLLTRQYDFIYAAVGVHPHEAKEWQSSTLDRLEALAGDSRVLAIGETGLDYHYDHSPRESQKDVFREQIRLARRLLLPISIHTRDAHDDTLRILEEEGAGEIGGVFHCFSGNREMADFAIDNHFCISFAGNLTFKNAEALRAVAADIPPESLLSETDAPFLSPHPHRGLRNEPVRAQEVVGQLALLHGWEMGKMGEQTTANFERTFPRIQKNY